MAVTKKVLITAAVAALAAFVGHAYFKLQRVTLASRGDLPVKHLNCHYLDGIEYGAEDITILKDGLAFMSTGLKYPPLPSFSDGPGKMYALDLLHPWPTPVELQIKGELDLSSFNPHGISVYEADDTVYLFVVNHPQPQKSQIEIFRFVEEDTLVHLKTIKHPLLHSVNDIVAVGVESFYATNDHFFHSDALSILLLTLGLQWCDVVYYSPGEVRVAFSGIQSSNGINISPDKRHIYVSDITDHDVDVFERREGEQLVFIKSVAVGSLCDNIEVDHWTGDLWLGCHPNSMKLSNFNPEDPPGSEIVKVKDIHSERPVVTQEYIDDGRVIIGSTVAAPYEGKLLIGSIFHKALQCDLK
ncbi:serum paraoxonase/arylesterase 2-like [Mugil cephalus]|uniref:serum paraoxonase/arylesterase 2-like n=1 Tax=Mugil cephalus TaxID=48193 RepID=UPI001FB6135D|nr:serum paraoxonase/arylesterase 2-like [Mugil cephalus]